MESTNVEILTVIPLHSNSYFSFDHHFQETGRCLGRIDQKQYLEQITVKIFSFLALKAIEVYAVG